MSGRIPTLYPFVDPNETFDSGATPKPGEQRRAPKTVADVDLEAFRKEMASTIEKAKADDPRELRRQLAEVKAELAKVKAAPARANEGKPREIPVLKAAEIRRLEAVAGRVDKAMTQLETWAQAFTGTERGIRNAAGAITDALVRLRVGPAPPVSARAELVRSQQRGSPPERILARPTAVMVSRRTEPGARLSHGEAKVLTAIAQHDGGATREQLTILTGYKRSTRDAYVQRLRERGHVDHVGEQVVATAAGVAALGEGFAPLPTGDALREHWLARLPAGERAVPRGADRGVPEADRPRADR